MRPSRQSAVEALGRPLVALVFLLLAAACSTVIPTPSPRPNQTTPSASLSPNPTPTPAPSLSPSPPTEPTLHIDGLATVAREGVRLWADTDNRDDPANDKKNYVTLESGSQVLLVDGPRIVDDLEYWQLYPSSRGYTTPLGWASVTTLDGTRSLTPFQPHCPPDGTVTAAQIAELDRFAVVSCFGNRELRLTGTVTCTFGIADGILAGPTFNSNIWCGIDQALSLQGPIITGLHTDTTTSPYMSGAYEVRGHFDDPGSNQCYQTVFGTSLNGEHFPGDPGAIQECRTFFVVTAVEKLTSP